MTKREYYIRIVKTAASHTYNHTGVTLSVWAYIASSFLVGAVAFGSIHGLKMALEKWHEFLLFTVFGGLGVWMLVFVVRLALAPFEIHQQDLNAASKELEESRARSEKFEADRLSAATPTVEIDDLPEIFKDNGAEHSYYRIRVRHKSGPPCLVTTQLASCEPPAPGLPLTLEFTHPIDGRWAKTLKPDSEHLMDVFVDRMDARTGMWPARQTSRIRLMGSKAAEIDVGSGRRLKFVSQPENGERKVKYFIVDFQGEKIGFYVDPNQDGRHPAS